ncbi:hypothetical protein UFOVP112_175 [uncultured Caudovirales phage]|uniref:Uncharacterized protein n=1 Tax=uncultured Caudovirales phage TaxID=2100421 RepID=A0A6J5L7P8_9CAUD|nr:hypothetical protein UFOVP112_175 [uncultured Caudovirales phage]
MKPFQSYIFEINKPYEFRIKLATVNPTGDVMDRIKSALDTYQLESVSAVKSIPIQEHKEFPQWGPCECWQFDIKVAYPVTVPQIRQTIKERAQLNPDWICVRNLGEAVDTDEQEAHGKDHEGALLDETELKDAQGAQELAGQSRIGSLLKELESRKFDFAASGETTGAMTSEDVGTTSPVGTHQNKVYKAKG